MANPDWHKHDAEDELPLVIVGSFGMQFRGSIFAASG
jgi:hypothetical protein